MKNLDINRMQKLSGIIKEEKQIIQEASPINTAQRNLQNYLKSIIGKPFDKKMASDIAGLASSLADAFWTDGARSGFQR